MSKDISQGPPESPGRIDPSKIQIRQNTSVSKSDGIQHSIANPLKNTDDSHATDVGLEEIKVRLEKLSPNSEEYYKHVIPAIIHYESKGSNEGLTTFDQWRSKDANYNGFDESKERWLNIDYPDKHPPTIELLKKILKEQNVTPASIPLL